MNNKERNNENIIEEDYEVHYDGTLFIIEPNKEKGYSQKWKTNKRGKLISGFF